MFVAVFGMLSLIYLIAATISESFQINPIFMVIADALNAFLFLIGGIALAAYLDVHSCGNAVGLGLSPVGVIALRADVRDKRLM